MNLKSKGSKKKQVYLIAKYMFLSLMAMICLFPLYFAISSSFKTTAEIMASRLAFPTSFTTDNYVRAWSVGNMGRYFLNTIVLTGAAMAICAVVGLLAAYVLSRFKFKLQGVIFTFFIAGLMIPMQSTIIPLAYNFGRFGLKNNYPALCLLFVAFQIPITVFILNAFMKSIPSELEEAAVMDGCSAIRTCFAIIAPVSAPALVTASIFNLINIWNNLLFPLIFITDKNMQTMAFGLLSFFSEWQSDYGGVMAAISLAIIPPLVIYVLLQEKVEQGITAGAVKG
ncbi:MAG: carbohydrate ABC transporter permease [Clostridia bacterium]